MANEVKVISANNFNKAEKEAEKLVKEGWEIKGTTTAVVNRLCGSRVELIITLVK